MSAGRVYTPDELDFVIADADMVESEAFEETEVEPDTGPIPAQHRPTSEQKAALNTLLRSLELADPGTDWLARCRDIVGGVSWELSTATMAKTLIEKLQAELGALVDGATPAA